ncbi:MAG: hypothetical protein GX221_11240 [Candidatus Riflebacteria bacterium]|nr:hypothetical protein [Candidatus Riflebacteria bacterium]
MTKTESFKYPYDYKKAALKPLSPMEYFRLKAVFPELKIEKIEPPRLGLPGFGKIYVSAAQLLSIQSRRHNLL